MNWGELFVGVAIGFFVGMTYGADFAARMFKATHKCPLVALVVLPWALWAHLETMTVPAKGVPLTSSEVVERFENYEGCDLAARWAESQPDLREDWTITSDGKRWHTTMTYQCRQEVR